MFSQGLTRRRTASPAQDRIRALHRQLLRTVRLVYPAPRLVEHLTAGLASKNNRTRVECAELLGEVLAEDGLAVFDRAKERPFPALALVRISSLSPGVHVWVRAARVLCVLRP